MILWMSPRKSELAESRRSLSFTCDGLMLDWDFGQLSILEVHLPRLLCLHWYVCAYGWVSFRGGRLGLLSYLQCHVNQPWGSGGYIISIQRIMAGFFSTEPSMDPPVGVYWLGESKDRVVMHSKMCFARSSTRSVLVCRLGVMLIDVDFLPMAKPFSNEPFEVPPWSGVLSIERCRPLVVFTQEHDFGSQRPED